jgi:dihydroxyacetone kinase
VLKTSPSLVKEIADELGVEEDVYLSSKTTKVPEITLKRLKISINTLVENIAKTARDEANSLKERNRILEAENTALREMLISRTQDKIKSYTLKQNEEKRFIN